MALAKSRTSAKQRRAARAAIAAEVAPVYNALASATVELIEARARVRRIDSLDHFAPADKTMRHLWTLAMAARLPSSDPLQEQAYRELTSRVRGRGRS